MEPVTKRARRDSIPPPPTSSSSEEQIFPLMDLPGELIQIIIDFALYLDPQLYNNLISATSQIADFVHTKYVHIRPNLLDENSLLTRNYNISTGDVVVISIPHLICSAGPYGGLAQELRKYIGPDYPFVKATFLYLGNGWFRLLQCNPISPIYPDINNDLSLVTYIN